MSRNQKTGRRSLRLAYWPAADRVAWQLALAPADPFDPSIGYANRWKPSTLHCVEDGYGHWLDWLTQSSQLVPDSAPAERATSECVWAYWHSMEADGLAPLTVGGRLQQLGNGLRAIAPAHDWAWLHRGASRLRSKATTVRDKQEGMQPPEDLFRLGLDLMHAAEHDRFRTAVERAVLFRDGLMLVMLVSRMLRRANITALRIGIELRRHEDQWRIAIEAADYKGGRLFECSVPDDLTPRIERYLEVHRRTLLDCTLKALPPTDAFWISKQGTQMTPAAVTYQVRSRTGEAFGTPTNPHTFRRIYATAKAIHTPSHANDIAVGLGHTDMRVGQRYYNLAKMVDAGDRYQATLDDIVEEVCGSKGKQKKRRSAPAEEDLE